MNPNRRHAASPQPKRPTNMDPVLLTFEPEEFLLGVVQNKSMYFYWSTDDLFFYSNIIVCIHDLFCRYLCGCMIVVAN